MLYIRIAISDKAYAGFHSWWCCCGASKWSPTPLSTLVSSTFLITEHNQHALTEKSLGFQCYKVIFLVNLLKEKLYLSRLVTKPTKWHVRPAKTQISLGIRPVWSESSLCALRVAKDPVLLHVDSEDSKGIMLIWVFAGRTLTSLVLSCRCSFVIH